MQIGGNSPYSGSTGLDAQMCAASSSQPTSSQPTKKRERQDNDSPADDSPTIVIEPEPVQLLRNLTTIHTGTSEVEVRVKGPSGARGRVAATSHSKPPLTRLIDDARAFANASPEREESVLYTQQLHEIEAYLKEHPEEVNETWVNAVTILHNAACSGLKKVVELLLRYSPDTSRMNCFDQTAAKRSRNMGFTEIADMIDAHTKASSSMSHTAV